MSVAESCQISLSQKTPTHPPPPPQKKPKQTWGGKILQGMLNFHLKSKLKYYDLL